MCVHVCIYIFVNATHAPRSLLELEVVHSALIQLTINSLEGNLSSSLGAAFAVCHCTRTDSAQTVLGGTGRGLSQGKVWDYFATKASPKPEGSHCWRDGWHRALGRHDWVCGFARWTQADGPSREVWSLNLSQENVFSVHSLNCSSGKKSLAQNVPEFSLLYPLQCFCLSQSAGTEGSSGLSMLVHPARISIFWPLIPGSHSFPSAQPTFLFGQTRDIIS